MKQLLLSFCGLFVMSLLQAQVTIGPYTVIPQNPTPNDVVKIVTNVTTNNQGVIVDLSHTVTGNQINLSGCYYIGMATALQTFIDTFTIGQLPGANYQINHVVYSSSGMQVCHQTGTFTAPTGSVQVSTPTVIRTIGNAEGFLLYPNPAHEKLVVKGAAPNAVLLIYSANGTLVRKAEVSESTAIDIHDLASGLYLAELSDANESRRVKFLKAE